jgi:hypothetical protein
MRMVEAGWDADVARRPRGQHTTVVVHVDVEQRAAALHLGPLLTDAELRYLTCDATCEVWFERDGQASEPGGDAGDQPQASSCPRAPPPHLRDTGLWRDPRLARTPHPALGGRRPHRDVQSGPGVPVSPPVAPSRRHHHHRTRRPSHRHRQCRSTTQRRIARAPAEPSAARRGPVPRLQRRARRLVVVPALPGATTTNQQLAADPTSCRPLHSPLSRRASCTSPAHRWCRRAAVVRIRLCEHRIRPGRPACRACPWRR